GLFLILLFLLMFVLSAQTSPQSVMLEEVARERRLRRQARGADAAYSSVYLQWLAKPLTLLRRFFAKTPDPNVTRRLALAGYRQSEHADVFLGARLAVPVVLGTLVAVTFKDGAFLFFII